MNLIIEEKLLNAVMQYLSTKPYMEVIGLISEIQKTVRPIPPTPVGEPQSAESGKDSSIEN